MRLELATLLALLSCATAGAATLYDPQVAYVQTSGGSSNLMVANADGSRAVKVAGVRGGIFAVDFAPGGGRLAYLDAQGLKVLSYVASNTGVTVTGTVTLVNAGTGIGIDAPDFSPDGTRLAYVHSTNTMPQAVRVVSATDGALLLSHPCSPCAVARWLRPSLGDAFAYLHYDASGPAVIHEIWTATIHGDGSVTAGPVLSTATGAIRAINGLDAARGRDALLVEANYATGARLVELDLATFALTDRGVGERAHFSADDSRIVSRTPHSASGDYVVSRVVATGIETRLTKKGSFGPIDARP